VQELGWGCVRSDDGMWANVCATDLRRRQHPLRRRAARRADAEHAAAAGVDVDPKKSSSGGSGRALLGKWFAVRNLLCWKTGLGDERAWGVGRVGLGKFARRRVYLALGIAGSWYCYPYRIELSCST